MSEVPDTPATIVYDDFHQVDMRVGTIVDITENAKARVPAYVIKIDFGEVLGIKTSSAQITERHQMADLIGKQVIAVTNFGPKRVAGTISEVLVLAAVSESGVATLIQPSLPVRDGSRIL
ncbi:MAG: tRNA-binding protein [Sphingomonadales bacterium]|jgi:tRNA-binding protein|nr:tRNA-binding protein [Sphingomonadales bacterium]